MTSAALILALLVVASPDAAERGRTIAVTGTATIETAPDRAVLTITLRGEGATPDAATRALSAKAAAVTAGLRALDHGADIRTGSVASADRREGDCGPAADPVDSSALSEMASAADAMAAMADAGPDSGAARKAGPCRVTGRVAVMEAEVTLRAVEEAGTAVGLASRLGATSARVDTFMLADDRSTTAQAVAAAVADARAKADAIARGAGARLGPIVSVEDSGAREAASAAKSLAVFDMAPPPAVALPPVVIAIRPKPVQTAARLVVTFALLP